MTKPKLQTATFGGGCFWCTEAIFKRLKGVESIVSGYAGGRREKPSSEQVTTGVSGHAESIQIQFDPTIISYDTLLDVFFATHDPTTLNRQEYDVGTQYRSVIFYHDDMQKKAAEEKMEILTREHRFMDPIVTQLTPFTTFYSAEEYHQNFYDSNRSYPYCRIIIDPKVQKLLSKFQDNLKDEYKRK